MMSQSHNVSLAAVLLAVLWTMAPSSASAHFQELIPSTDIVTAATGATVDLALTFTHPMENGPVMDMGEPVRFGVLAGSRRIDLAAALRPAKVGGHTAYRASFRIPAPADYVFFVEPAAYWEPSEGRMIVHYAKVVVDAFAAEEGWDAMVGLPVEIEPLVRPYGLWTGNVFRGLVRRDGRPVPFATVEVEHRSEGAVTAPAAPFVTQVIKADAGGVFTYAMPRAGWWGFAALVTADEKAQAPDGSWTDLELGGLMWVRVVDMK